ncbi:GntR family transcriptional regulator [Oceanibium sediminis]|uniref:GntR family transcriptional regulator n=1 Tax=Oceanibium sediminis TaxID=2026339 RepID=UPI000DD3F673|nr:GntR family transcriptional regulator [Oceanibium sediminis]
MTKPAHLTTTSQPIYDSLRDEILSGAIRPGEPLRQDEIAKRHGISKIPVREALLKLEADGFVLFRKNRGAMVRELSAAELLHLMDIRVALECKALELAIPNMIQSDFDVMHALLKQYAEVETVEHWSSMNQSFHNALYEPCGNAQLLDMIRDIQQRMGPALRLLMTEASGLDRPNEEHHAILSACESGDVTGAVDLLRAHIETSKKETAARLRRRDTV